MMEGLAGVADADDRFVVAVTTEIKVCRLISKTTKSIAGNMNKPLTVAMQAIVPITNN